MRTRGRDGGYTLVELLTAIVIIGVIMGPLAGALIVAFRTTTDTHTSLEQSNAEQLISTYFTKDVQRAEGVVYAPSTVCGGKVEFKSRSSVTASAPDTVYAYVLSGTTLTRVECNNSGTTLDSTTLARNVTSFSASGTATVTASVATSASTAVPAYSWSLQATRRPT